MDWIDAVLGLLGVLSLAAFGFSIRLALCAKTAAANVERQLGKFMTEVAKTYASNDDLTNVDKRIMHELEKIGQKLDRLIEQRRDGR